jgi:CxxC-x17-CxxC domain-containing protein
MTKHSQNDSDILGLINKIQEHLASLERKIDTLVNRSFSKPPESKPATQPFSKSYHQPSDTFTQSAPRHDNRFHHGGNRRDDRHGERFMHKAICADCKRDCQVPFRPSGNRPVYCKECFTRRKNSDSFKTNIDDRSRQPASFETAGAAHSHTFEKKRFFTKKRFTDKKRPFSKKKKGKR